MYVNYFKANKALAAAGPKAHKKSSREEKDSTLAQFVARTQTDMIKMKRIPGIFRGAACAADPKWQNFCVLQQQPIASLYDIPDVSPPTISADMAAFAEQVIIFENLNSSPCFVQCKFVTKLKQNLSTDF